MKSRIAGALRRLSGRPPQRRSGRWIPRPIAEEVRAIESPRGAWPFGPQLQRKAIPIRRGR